ncbi:DNA-binding transcriptional regulator LsrR, DeoR family [Jannaschia faecimaris]|uniref:DNA-binding transcriptional regulator LsrR, DeoR family n=1 Tax=Jannaschia faecimaris TaxID=1244108 RepID=A0A1H3P600_9RHOB|nr:sugar-binding transcriptional regulator [Jannaschia faecimaris]SDY96393.1 DNA-binding transcriptional regulator LsrR, DeoR family [Jannaschia faecimaris]
MHPRESEDSLAVRAAWMHHVGGMTQAQVATRLGISGVKAHRLVAHANRIGAIRVTVEGDILSCLEAEQALAQRFGLTECRVVPDLHETGLPLRALGQAGAQFLEEEMRSQPEATIGVGHGRTLGAVVSALPQMDAARLRFVSLLGGLTRTYAANPHDVMHRLTERTGAEAYVLPVPFFANSTADRDVFLGQRGVGDVVAMGLGARLMIAGIGTVQPDAQIIASRLVEAAEVTEVMARGGQGELLGHFFDAAGQSVETGLTARTLSPDLAHLRERRIVAIAGGETKVAAIRAVLQSGLLSGLIADERTAQSLIGDVDGTS